MHCAVQAVGSVNVAAKSTATTTTAPAQLAATTHMSATTVQRKYTICPKSFDSFDIVNYYIKWVKTSWTNISNFKNNHFGKLYLRDDKLDKN